MQGGSGEYRIRVGSYLVVYEIQDKQLIILVLNVGHCREI
ncbi:type II toxin-antitoxin system RelE/ParE family toxin [Corynebacterium sp.]|nr:type II toxin-antitoxin system RelE/ParE family toxin [Corynebacterium sp.]